MSPLDLRFKLTEDRYRQFLTLARSQTAEYRLVMRARIIVDFYHTASMKKTAENVGVEPETVSIWVHRVWENPSVESLQDRPRPGAKKKFDEHVENQIVGLACSFPYDHGLPHGKWTLDLLSTVTAESENMPTVSSTTVQRMLSRHWLRPWKFRSWKRSKDPEFEHKAGISWSLLLMPPSDAVVLSHDEKPGILLRAPKGTCRPALPGKAVHVPFEYERHGTLCLHAGFDVHSGHVLHELKEKNAAVNYVETLNMYAVYFGTDTELFILRDGSRTHSAPLVRDWFAAHPNFMDVPLPTGASWLNPVEPFFGIVQRQCLDGAHFTIPDDVRGKENRKAWLRERKAKHIEAYIVRYNQSAHPFRYGQPKVRRSLHGMLGLARQTSTGYRFLRPRAAFVTAGRRGRFTVAS